MRKLLAKISRQFEGGSRDAAGDLSDGRLSPEDVVCHRVLELLAADGDLVAIFEGRMEFMPTRPTWDFRDFPRLQVYAGSTSETQAPTQLAIDQVSVIVSIRMDGREIPPVRAWSPGLSTLAWHIQKILRADRTLVDQVAGQQVPLAMEGRPQPTNYVIELEPDTGRPALVLEIPWVYRVDVDQPTGRIANIVRAGG